MVIWPLCLHGCIYPHIHMLTSHIRTSYHTHTQTQILTHIHTKTIFFMFPHFWLYELEVVYFWPPPLWIKMYWLFHIIATVRGYTQCGDRAHGEEQPLSWLFTAPCFLCWDQGTLRKGSLRMEVANSCFHPFFKHFYSPNGWQGIWILVFHNRTYLS